MEEKDVKAAEGAAQAETAAQKFGTPKAHSHSSRTQAGNYPPKVFICCLTVMSQ